MQPTTHLFTIRIWQEEIESGVFEWRGSVRYGIDGQVLYFAGVNSLADACLPDMMTQMIGQLEQGADAANSAER